MAVFAVTLIFFLFRGPLIFNKDKICIESLLELLFSVQLGLVGCPHDKRFVSKLWQVARPKELYLEVAGVVLLLILVHTLVDEGLFLQGHLNLLQVIILLVKILHLFVFLQGKSIASRLHQLLNDLIDFVTQDVDFNVFFSEVYGSLLDDHFFENGVPKDVQKGTFRVPREIAL